MPDTHDKIDFVYIFGKTNVGNGTAINYKGEWKTFNDVFNKNKSRQSQTYVCDN